MATYNEQLQRIWHSYGARYGHMPASTHAAVDWAVGNGLLVPPKIDPLAQLAEDMAKALREEYRTDLSGRRYRVNHALRITAHGVQTSLWAAIETAPREYMVKAFAQRRNQVVADCLQLKTDVDVYNDAHTGGEPIQLVLDFTEDVAELQSLEGARTRAA